MTSPDQEPAHSCEATDSLEVLLFETSPYENVDAIVQHDQRSLYFYLQPKNGEFASRACWVRNLVPGPYVINQDDLLNGRQVLLPKTYAKSPQAGLIPRPDKLSIVWFEEGNGAALQELKTAVSESEGTERQEILAIIPPWSGQDGFHGYAAECAMDSPVCWPLPKNRRLQQRVKQAADFWSSFLQPPDPFVGLRDQLLAAYQNLFCQSPSGGGMEHQYFDISSSRFPPRGMMQYQFADSTILVTVGMSLCPQPNVELSMPEPQLHRRIELAIELPAAFEPERLASARQQLAQLAGYPWRNFRWLGVGHTCEFKGVFDGKDKAMLAHSPAVDDTSEGVTMPQFRNDPIQLIWLV
jgi:hypothetical protein